MVSSIAWEGKRVSAGSGYGEIVEEYSDTAILVVAAGRGLRAGGGLPKQYRRIAGRMVLTRTIEQFANTLPGASLVCVIHPDDERIFQQAIQEVRNKALQMYPPVNGGASRQESVLAGLDAVQAISKIINTVLIHDSVRCFTSKKLIMDLVAEARLSGAAIPGYRISDAMKYASSDLLVSGSVPREGLFAVQTPQAFDLGLIHDAHRRARKAGVSELPDDAGVAGWAGTQVRIVESSEPNIKLTTLDDFEHAETLLMNQLADLRTGQGFDVHAFCDGDGFWLGGTWIPHSKSLSGHSDADVALHALTDAVLGAIGAGDIGSHFPPSDPQWKDASSDRFLVHAVSLVAARGGQISHLDLTIIAEEPKIGPHRQAMRDAIATMCGLDKDRVSVKATTTEQLGFTGRREGIAAQAVATVRLPLTGAGDE